MARIDKQTLSVEYALLGFLYERPMHAYEIHQTLARSDQLGFVWKLKQGQLYALLGRLEEEGLVESSVEQQNTRPPRKVLRLTSAGRESLERWVVEPVRHQRELRLVLLAKLWFALRQDPDVARQLLSRQSVECRLWLSGVEDRLDHIPLGQIYERTVLEFRRSQIHATVEWLETAKRSVSVAETANGV